MPTRINVPELTPSEESRQIAESIADLHYVMSTIMEGAKELIPGESVQELADAWNASEGEDRISSIRQLNETNQDLHF